MTRRAGAAFAAVMMSVALVATACGSSSKSSDANKKAAFIAQADGICRSYNDLATNATKNLKHPNAQQMVSAIQHRLVPLFLRQDNELAQLQPPAADRATISTFITDLKAATDDVAAHPQTFVSDHGATPLAKKAAAEAAAYGFAVCARL
jgi:hypothetical protein